MKADHANRVWLGCVATVALVLSCRATAAPADAAPSSADAATAPKAQAQAQTKKPNILFIVSDDTGYGDLGPYGGGIGRGMPTPNIDRLAQDGMTFFSYYAQ